MKVDFRITWYCALLQVLGPVRDPAGVDQGEVWPEVPQALAVERSLGSPPKSCFVLESKYEEQSEYRVGPR